MEVSEQAFVHPTAAVAEGVGLAPFVYVGERVRIGPGTSIGPGASILDDCEIGSRVRIGPGAVIGCEGFGYQTVAGKHEHVAHLGAVAIEDDVDIGANCTIARAKTGMTRIGAGTKIDALVHIGHNVTIGRNCILIAQVGVAGSVRIGRGVILAGQVGIKDHVTIGDNSVVYAKSALYRSIPAGSHYSGIPARPHKENLKSLARLRRKGL